MDATKRRFVSGDEAEVGKKQHSTPCADCPWRRTSINGWLGALSADEWLSLAHGEGSAECHTSADNQCVGLAVYRANICKLPRNPELIRFPADREKVFGMPSEFKEHHEI